jgi:hypothetical protein
LNDCGSGEGVSRHVANDDSSACRASAQLGTNPGVAASPPRRSQPGVNATKVAQHASVVSRHRPFFAKRTFMLAILTSGG